MIEDHIGVKIDGVIYVKLEDVKPMRDRIEKLEAALRELLSLGEWGTNALARTIILESLDEKD
jgi:hypothetical protein